MSQLQNRQEENLPTWCFYSSQAFNWLNEAHPRQKEESALLNSKANLIQKHPLRHY